MEETNDTLILHQFRPFYPLKTRALRPRVPPVSLRFPLPHLQRLHDHPQTHLRSPLPLFQQRFQPLHPRLRQCLAPVRPLMVWAAGLVMDNVGEHARGLEKGAPVKVVAVVTVAAMGEEVDLTLFVRNPVRPFIRKIFATDATRANGVTRTRSVS